MRALDSRKYNRPKFFSIRPKHCSNSRQFFPYPMVLHYLLQQNKNLETFSCWRQPVNASLPSKVKMTFINYQCLSPYPKLPQHRHKNRPNLELICLGDASHRTEKICSKVSSLLYFISWPQQMLIPQISQSQVCCQEQPVTSRYSRGPSHFKQ